MQQKFDIVIVGGGLAGTALACALADTGYQLALLEGGDYTVQRPQVQEGVTAYDTRVSALSHSSVELLQRLDAWSRIGDVRCSPYARMQVWDAEGTGEVFFDAAQLQQQWLGYIVENRVSLWALRQALLERGTVFTRGGCKVVQMTPVDGADAELAQPTYTLQLDDGCRVSANLVVAADGALSAVRGLAGFKTREWDYGHVATVATVRMQQPHASTAWQRFLPQGPLAFLPLESGDKANHLCSIVWSAQAELANELAGYSDDDFCQALTRAFEGRLGKVLEVGPRIAYPLRQRHAVQYYQPGVVLVGDAAHTLHPLAGQGINLGFKDVAALTEELMRAERLGLAPGTASVLARYQRRRLADNLGMMAVMEGFKRLFAQRELAVRWLRNEGMRRFNRSPLIKQQLMRRAMGL